MKRYALASSLLAVLMLSGCAQPKVQPLYGWHSYEAQIDAWFRQTATSPDAQLQRLQDDLEKMQAAGQRPPPGFWAHMGLLHGQLGDPVSFRAALEAEKAAFPESTPYMTFLLRHFKDRE